MDSQGNTVTPGAPDPELNRIPSVNSRGGVSSNILSKVVFVIAVVAVLAIGGIVTFKKLNTDASNRKTERALAAKSENKPAAVTGRRKFDAEASPTHPASGTTNTSDVAINGAPACSDGGPGTMARSANGEPLLDAQGQPMRFCGDGKMIVPALEVAGTVPPIPVSGTHTTTTAAGQPQPHVDRYGGDVILSGGSPTRAGSQADAGDPMNNPLIRAALGQGLGQGAGAQKGLMATSSGPQGSVGSLLQPSVTQAVQAGKIGDRNMILPMGRSIECGLSVRMVSALAGLTSCVLSQNVYSDNGRVVLLERGSEATGEYRAVSEQGQRRLFIIWTRIKTPNGILINLDSPGSDSLGTSGLPGGVDNHWWQRVGGAFLLSTVKDAIAYKTAEASGNGAGGAIFYQNTATTGDRMAEKVLDSTINIRPTIYKNQGDRGSIYVARDLDFGSVYALRAQ